MSEDMCIYEVLLRLPKCSDEQDHEVIIGAIHSSDQASRNLLAGLGAIAGGQHVRDVELQFGAAAFSRLSHDYCRKLGVTR